MQFQQNYEFFQNMQMQGNYVLKRTVLWVTSVRYWWKIKVIRLAGSKSNRNCAAACVSSDFILLYLM